jgi:hypothetical protein
MTQPLVQLYGDCMVVLKVSRCGIIYKVLGLRDPQEDPTTRPSI